jgi:peptidyl-prolyl cis-trans isomerase SurA
MMLRIDLPVIVSRLFAVAVFCAPLGLPVTAEAQVVVIANGSPITELDIAQRSKLTASSTHKVPTRQEVIKELIDDRIKIAKAKYYGLEVSDADLNDAFASMAKRQNISPQQFAQVLEHEGISANALKARIKAEMTWQQLVRGKFGSALQVGDADVALAMQSKSDEAGKDVGYVYTLYPVMVVVPSGSSPTTLEAKRREADNLRGRFVSCAAGLPLARALRDVAVREPVTRSSADLTPQFRELLGSMEIGRLTTPDVTAQGLQMFALCEKKTSKGDSPAKTELRQQIYLKRFEAESKKFLDEIRKQAMIEYK